MAGARFICVTSVLADGCDPGGLRSRNVPLPGSQDMEGADSGNSDRHWGNADVYGTDAGREGVCSCDGRSCRQLASWIMDAAVSGTCFVRAVAGGIQSDPNISLGWRQNAVLGKWSEPIETGVLIVVFIFGAIMGIRYGIFPFLLAVLVTGKTIQRKFPCKPSKQAVQ